MGWRRFSSAVFFSRWSVQRAPTGHKLFMLCSSLAGSWEESRRKLLSWSFRAHGVIPLSSSVAFYYHQARSACLLWGNNISTIWRPLQIHNVKHIISVGDVRWYLLKQTTGICCPETNSRCDSLTRSHLAPVYQQTHAPIRTQKGLCSHGSSVGRWCTSADGPRQFAKFWPVSPLTNKDEHTKASYQWKKQTRNIEVIR